MNVAVGVVALLSVGGAAFVIVGVHMLVGLPWALIGMGALMLGAATLLRAGLAHG